MFVALAVAMILAQTPSEFSDSELIGVAYQLLPPLDSMECSESYIGGTVADCDRALRVLAGARAKFAHYQPDRMRDAILHTIDYLQKRARENRADCVTQTSKHSVEQYEKEQVERDRKVGAALKIVRKNNSP